MSDAHPLDELDVLPYLRIGLARKGCRDYFFDTGSARCVREQSRINAVSGDDS